MKAIKEFKASLEFKAKVIEGSLVAYGYGFDACKVLVVHFFPEVDIS